MAPTEIYRDEAGEWRFRVKGANGEVVAVSEGYTTRSGAIRGAADLTRIVTDETGGQAGDGE